jgi:Tol biopolymer transport system component
MTISDGRQTDIWVYDWERDILTRVTSDASQELGPVWTPDGTTLVFASNRDSNVGNLYWKRADGTGPTMRLTTSDNPQIPDAFSPDGRVLVLHEGDPTTSRQSLTMVSIERDGAAIRGGTSRRLIEGAFLKANARISPDGKWMAYAANDTGAFEIYVQPFPGLGERVQVSAGGGNLALWSPTSSELYYSGPGRSRLMVVPYSISGSAFVPAKPRQWSLTEYSATPPISVYGPSFDIHPDGKRFAVTPPAEPVVASVNAAQLVVVFNFFDELRRLAPIR